MTRFGEKYDDPRTINANWKCKQLDRDYIRKCLASGLKDMGIRCLDDQNPKGEMFYLSKQHQKPLLSNSSLCQDVVVQYDSSDKQKQVIRPANPYSCRNKLMKNVELELRYQAFKECIVGKFEKRFWQKNRPIGSQHLLNTLVKCSNLSFENVVMEKVSAAIQHVTRNVAMKQKPNMEHGVAPLEDIETKKDKMSKKTQKFQKWKTNNVDNNDAVCFDAVEPRMTNANVKHEPLHHVAVGSEKLLNVATRKGNKYVDVIDPIKNKNQKSLNPTEIDQVPEITEVTVMVLIDGVSAVKPVKAFNVDNIMHQNVYETHEADMHAEKIEFQKTNFDGVTPEEVSKDYQSYTATGNKTKSDTPINQLNMTSNEIKKHSKKSKKKRDPNNGYENEDALIVNPVISTSSGSNEDARDDSKGSDNIYKIINETETGKGNKANHAVKTDTPLETQENIKDKLYKSKPGTLNPRNNGINRDIDHLKDIKQPNEILSPNAFPTSNINESDNKLGIEHLGLDTSLRQTYDICDGHVCDLNESKRDTSNLPGLQLNRRVSIDETFESPFIDPNQVDEAPEKLTRIVGTRLDLIDDAVEAVIRPNTISESGLDRSKHSGKPDNISYNMDYKMENEFVNLESTSSLMIVENSNYKNLQKNEIQLKEKSEATDISGMNGNLEEQNSDENKQGLGNQTSNDDDYLNFDNKQGTDKSVNIGRDDGKQFWNQDWDDNDDLNFVSKQGWYVDDMGNKVYAPNKQVKGSVDTSHRYKHLTHGEKETHDPERNKERMGHKESKTNQINKFTGNDKNVKTKDPNIAHKYQEQVHKQGKPISNVHETDLKLLNQQHEFGTKPNMNEIIVVTDTEQVHKEFGKNINKFYEIYGSFGARDKSIDKKEKGFKNIETTERNHTTDHRGLDCEAHRIAVMADWKKPKLLTKPTFSKPYFGIGETENIIDTSNKKSESSGGGVKSTVKYPTVKSLVPVKDVVEKLCKKYSKITNIKQFPDRDFSEFNQRAGDKNNFSRSNLYSKTRSMVSKPAPKTAIKLPKNCLFSFTLMPNQSTRNTEFKLPIKSYCKLIDNTARCNSRIANEYKNDILTCRKFPYPSSDVGKGSRLHKSKNISNVQNMYGMTCLMTPLDYCNKSLKSVLLRRP